MPVSTERTDELKPYRRAIRQITEDIFRKYCMNSASILEVGSGTFPITELLPHLPEAFKSRIDFSDISDKSLQFLKEQYPQTNIQKFDILSGSPTERTYERVVMVDVLNLFSRDQLEIAFKNISQVLCPGGIFLHFSIRETFYNHVLDEFIGSGTVFFPLFGATWKEAYIIRKSDVEDLIRELKAEYIYLKEILTEYISLSATERLNFCTERFASREIKIFQEIIDCLERFKFSNLQRISFEERYQSRLKRVASTSGFNLLEFQEKEAYFLGARVETAHHRYQDINLFAIDRLLRRRERLRELSPELVQEESKIHVMAAQKPLA
jgi:SAM-dependent methyltransferase